MKTLLSISLLFFVISCYGQTDSTQVEVFERKVQQIEVKSEKITNKSEELKSSSEYQQEIKELNKDLIQLQVGSSGNTASIQALKTQIASLEELFNKSLEREKEINQLNTEITKLKADLDSFNKYKELTQDEQKLTNSLIAKTSKINNDLLNNEIFYLIGNVEGWKPLTADLTILSNTAESVLIFDDKTSKKLWNGIKKGGLDVLTIAAGALAVNQFDKGEQGEAYASIGLGVGFKVLQTQIKDNATIERVTRNIAFADEIRAYAAIAVPLDSTVELLLSSIPLSPVDRSKWFPTQVNLNQYKKIIDYMEEIQFQNMLLKNKAEYLIQIGKNNDNLSDEGKALLEMLIKYYNKSVNDWDTIQPLYLARYDILSNELQKREKELLVAQ